MGLGKTALARGPARKIHSWLWSFSLRYISKMSLKTKKRNLDAKTTDSIEKTVKLQDRFQKTVKWLYPILANKWILLVFPYLLTSLQAGPQILDCWCWSNNFLDGSKLCPLPSGSTGSSSWTSFGLASWISLSAWEAPVALFLPHTAASWSFRFLRVPAQQLPRQTISPFLQEVPVSSHFKRT